MSFLANDKMKFPSNSLQECTCKIPQFLCLILQYLQESLMHSTSAWVSNPDSILPSHWGQRTEFFASKIQIGSFIGIDFSRSDNVVYIP